MATLRGLIRHYVSPDSCPPPPDLPSRPAGYRSLFAAGTQGELESPEDRQCRALGELPPSPALVESVRNLEDVMRDAASGEGNLRQHVVSLPAMGPEPWSRTGRKFTASTPAAPGYNPRYYKVGVSGGRDLTSVLRDDPQIPNLANVSSTASYKEALENERLMKGALCSLSYAEHSLLALASALKAACPEDLPQDVVMLADSLHLSIGHSIDLVTKASANHVLKRRDTFLGAQKSIKSPLLQGALRTAPLSGPFLFADAVNDTVVAQQSADQLYGLPAERGQGQWRIPKIHKGPQTTKEMAPPSGRVRARRRPYPSDPPGVLPVAILNLLALYSRQQGAAGAATEVAHAPLAVVVPARHLRPFVGAGVASHAGDFLYTSRPTLGPLGCPSMPVVGGRLRHYADFWDNWCPPGSPVPNMMRYGVKLDFKHLPPTTRAPNPVKVPRDPVKAEALRTEVRTLLQKEAVQVIEDPRTPGYYSHIFLVLKKNGSLRLVIDLSRLNKFLVVPNFKMETTRSVATAIQPGDWAVSLDLKDAYFHIPIHPDYQHFLRFYFEGQVYQFQALPFGLATAPLIFTMVVRAFVAPLHALGLKVHFYLDDWLLRCHSRELLQSQLAFLIEKATLAGWIINEEKSEMIPSQDFVFIGIRFMTLLGLMLPPTDRICKILSFIALWRQKTWAFARESLQLLGLLNSAADQIPMARLYMRPLQLLLLSQWRPHVDALTVKTRVPQDLLEQVWKFWWSETNLRKGVELHPPQQNYPCSRTPPYQDGAPTWTEGTRPSREYGRWRSPNFQSIIWK